MKVISLETQNYRNISDGKLTADPDINIIYGNNAQGKTNLLEAIWLFTGAKSFRGAKDNEFIRFKEQNAKISLKFKSRGRVQNSSIIFSEKKEVVLNKVKLQSANELRGGFGAVIFAPAHLTLVSEGPSVRRKYLDGVLCGLKPKYSAALNDYAKAVSQRSSILRDAKYHSELIELCSVFEQQAAAAGSYISETRKKFVDFISPVIGEYYGGISKSREKLEIEYESSANDGDYSVYGLLKSFEKSRNEDIITGNTSVGPHRDDLKIFINGVPARDYASQGQMRSIVLALKLGEAYTIANFINEEPVILLDDIMSELDSYRKKYILNSIKGRQIFITCCDKSDLRGLSGGKTYYMKNGIYTEKKTKRKTEE